VLQGRRGLGHGGRDLIPRHGRAGERYRRGTFGRRTHHGCRGFPARIDIEIKKFNGVRPGREKLSSSLGGTDRRARRTQDQAPQGSSSAGSNSRGLVRGRGARSQAESRLAMGGAGGASRLRTAGCRGWSGVKDTADSFFGVSDAWEP